MWCARTVDIAGVEVRVTAGWQRVVLGTLLLRANEVVSFEEIADAVWDGHPPRSARPTVRNYVRLLPRPRPARGPGRRARRVGPCPPHPDRSDAARQHWQRAVDVLADLGTVEMEDVPPARPRRDRLPPRRGEGARPAAVVSAAAGPG